MQDQRDLVLIDALISKKSENNCVEFKHNSEDPNMIGKLCSALSNSARIEEVEFAYVVWGIEDGTKRILGTTFNPETKKIGNQVFTFWLSQKLNLKIKLSFRRVNHPQGNMVLLEIPATHTVPIEFDRAAYIRIGSATPRLSDYSEYHLALINSLRSHNWETAIAKSFVSKDDVLKLLNYPDYFKYTKQNLPSNIKGIIEKLSADNIIKKDVGEYWNITNLGAILFAANLNDFDDSISRKGIRFVEYNGDSRASSVYQRIDGTRGYATAYSRSYQLYKKSTS